jgi:drug/metabolite transporter (DMT)-like permease
MNGKAPDNPRVLLFSVIALVAFAANSILARLALGGSAIDPAGFSAVRLASGAIMLTGITLGRNRNTGLVETGGSWISAFALFLYAVSFSFAYQTLTTGTGALILFGSVQATMMIAGLHAGERPHGGEWTGLIIALCGLVYLVSPGLEAPDPVGASLMVTAGVAWGWYSLRGRAISNPLRVTTSNFLRTLPLVLLLCVFAYDVLSISGHGALLAVGSGAVASGIGYAVWYAALRGLTAARASIIQLAVPVIAALGGVIFLLEEITVRLVFSAVMILGGVAIALVSRRQ